MQESAEWNAFYLVGNLNRTLYLRNLSVNSFSFAFMIIKLFLNDRNIPKTHLDVYCFVLCATAYYYYHRISLITLAMKLKAIYRWWYTITLVVGGRCWFGPENVRFRSLNREEWRMCQIWFNLPIKFKLYTINLPAIVHYWSQTPNKCFS